MREQIYDYDPAQALNTPEAITTFINDAVETGDAAHIAKAREVAERAKCLSSPKGTGLDSASGAIPASTRVPPSAADKTKQR